MSESTVFKHPLTYIRHKMSDIIRLTMSDGDDKWIISVESGSSISSTKKTSSSFFHEVLNDPEVTREELLEASEIGSWSRSERRGEICNSCSPSKLGCMK